MSFPRYPAYKDSGVEWLGEVPEHWSLSKLGVRCSFQSGKAHEPFVVDEGQYICVNSRFVSTGGGKVKRCSENLSPASTNDILLVMSDLPNGRALGKAFYVDKDNLYAVNQRVCRITTNKDFPKYIYYFLDRNPGLLWFDDGVNQTHIPNSGFTKLFFAVPPMGEQISIASFLDRETAKIDALIAEQQRLIELLQEKRQAVISHAVTKGLNPDAPMKDSGVEWLGEVPEHWLLKPTRRLIRSIEQGWSPQCENYSVDGSEGWGVLKVGCVNGGVFRSTENKSLPVELDPKPELAILKDDLLVSRANTRELVGSAAVAGQDYPNLLLCDKLYRLRVHRKEARPQFLSFFLGSREARSQIELEASGASNSMLNISQSVILELSCPAPPADEQEIIVEAINRQLNHLLNLFTEAAKAIKLLQERRSALISAAVTGQIDVRVLVPETVAA